MKLNILCLAIESTIKSIHGKGKMSLGHALLRSMKSTHICHFLFEFFMSTMFESHSG